MNIFKEYIAMLKKITTYPKNISDTLFRDNAAYITKNLLSSFLTEEEKINLFQNYLFFFLREKQTLHFSDILKIGEMGFYYMSLFLRFNRCQIQSLNLNYNAITKDSSNNLSLGLYKNRTIKELHLNGTNLSEECCEDISQAISDNKYIKLLEIGYNNNLKTEALIVLCNGIRNNTSIYTLFLSDNVIKKEGAKILADMIKVNKTIGKLYIEKNELEDEGIGYIADALKHNKMIQTLNISDNRIGHNGLLCLYDTFTNLTRYEFANYSIIELYMKNNLINNSEAIKILGKIISHNCTIKYIDLSNNGISDNLVLPISEALKTNNTLETLILESNILGGIGCKILCQGLRQNTGVKVLNLRNNSLGYEGGKNISELLTYNKTLKYINLQANLLDEHSISLIIDKLNYNSDIKSINLMNNQLSNMHDIMMNVAYAKDIIIY
jgi:Ran GTPase-activating protein (RanGAP) involved in mRNA processing and transport